MGRSTGFVVTRCWSPRSGSRSRAETATRHAIHTKASRARTLARVEEQTRAAGARDSAALAPMAGSTREVRPARAQADRTPGVERARGPRVTTVEHRRTRWHRAAPLPKVNARASR